MGTREEKLLYKNRLKRFCEQEIEQRIASTRDAMANAQSAANNEEKSSAGDKYETARAMSHLEKDMHARQLMAHLQQLSSLHDIDTNIIYSLPVAGALIQCGKTSFFIAAGLGKRSVDNVSHIFLSPQSPLAQKLANKKPGDYIDFDGKMMIVDIF
jgi:hypothetical protein